ncbi:hypothetical protein CBI55_19340, partial [Pseudomonas syringae]|uniref:hypothetical protein n=1 Tax=Pseudomonas syringae TaxID=317 RepID=UPI000C4EB789
REEWMAAWLPHVLWAPRFVSLPSTPLTPDFTLIKDTSELAREGVAPFTHHGGRLAFQRINE